jgi:putative two-component system response regulator
MSHHEKWDGSGYPAGLHGEEIPLAARIVAIADVFDALTSERPYKKAWTVEDAAAFIRKESGAHFDPKLVKVFEDVLPEMLKIMAMYRDGPEPYRQIDE